MTTDQIVYTVFGIVILIALTLDLGFLSKKNTTITIRQAMRQTFLWVLLALGFFVFMWVEEGQKIAFEYLSGYLMEWSLSIDNIFVFILIFDAFKVKEIHLSRVLLIGILAAIVSDNTRRCGVANRDSSISQMRRISRAYRFSVLSLRDSRGWIQNFS